MNEEVKKKKEKIKSKVDWLTSASKRWRLRNEREREDEEETLCDCGGALIFCPERIQDADQQSLVVPSVIVL